MRLKTDRKLPVLSVTPFTRSLI